MNEKRQDKKLVGYLAASLPASNATPNYDSYMHFKRCLQMNAKQKIFQIGEKNI